MLITILAPITHAFIGAQDTALIAFAVLFQASTFFAMTSFRVNACVFQYFWLERIWIPLEYRLNSSLSLFVANDITAILAIAFGTTA